MSRDFLMLWPKHRLDEAATRGWVGKPLPALYGGPHVSHPSLLRHGVGPGDVVYPVCVSDGQLLILARVAVAEVVPVDEFVRRQRDGLLPRVPPETLSWLVPTCIDDAAVVSESTPLCADCAVPPDVLETIRLVSPKGVERPLKHVKAGRLTHISGINGHYYRLSDTTAQMFEWVIGRG